MACFRGNQEKFYGEVLLLDETKISLTAERGIKVSENFLFMISSDETSLISLVSEVKSVLSSEILKGGGHLEPGVFSPEPGWSWILRFEILWQQTSDGDNMKLTWNSFTEFYRNVNNKFVFVSALVESFKNSVTTSRAQQVFFLLCSILRFLSKCEKCVRNKMYYYYHYY